MAQRTLKDERESPGKEENNCRECGFRQSLAGTYSGVWRAVAAHVGSGRARGGRLGRRWARLGRREAGYSLRAASVRLILGGQGAWGRCPLHLTHWLICSLIHTKEAL